MRDPGGTWHHLGGQAVTRPAVREQASMLKHAFELIMQSINPERAGGAPVADADDVPPDQRDLTAAVLADLLSVQSEVNARFAAREALDGCVNGSRAGSLGRGGQSEPAPAAPPRRRARRAARRRRRGGRARARRRRGGAADRRRGRRRDRAAAGRGRRRRAARRDADAADAADARRPRCRRRS